MIFYEYENSKLINIMYPKNQDSIDLLTQDRTEENYHIADSGENLQIYDENRNHLYEKGTNGLPVENSNRLTDLKSSYKEKISKLAFEKRNSLLPDYKISNAALDIYNEATKIKIKTCIESFRAEFYRMEALVNLANNEDGLKTILKGNRYDKIIFE